MQLVCPRCETVLSYADERPSFCSRCGAALGTPTPPGAPPGQAATVAGPTAAETAEAPDRVGNYRLLRPLGAGGMGSVYEAEDPGSGRRVAVKLLSADYAESAEGVERFRREGQLASTLAHPRCVFVFAADEDAGRPYIVMELMPGRTLEDLVAERGPLPPAEAVARILDVIDGLEEAHRLGFIHRDVKPSNCFLDRQGRVKVGDFGLAKALARGGRLTRTGSFLGTPLYAAPEQIKGEAVDPQTDVYAVAATLYYLLTGRAPFEGGDAAATLARIVSEPPPPLRTLRPELPPGLDDVVLRGLERDRARRWRTLAEFGEALRPFRPGQASAGVLGLRFAAYLIDLICAGAIQTAFNIPLLLLVGGGRLFNPDLQARPSWFQPVGIAVGFLYYALLEGLTGASLGKHFLNFRVLRAGAGAPAGLPRALLRTAVYAVVMSQGLVLWAAAWLLYLPPDTNLVAMSQQAPAAYYAVLVLPVLGMAVGGALLLGPMRAGNGYRGLHEWLSGTRVVHLPRAGRWRGPSVRPADRPVLHPDGLPERLGPFAVLGALRWDDRARVLLGQDRSLGRTVWLWLRPRAAPPVPAGRREVGRATRPRWLAGGQDGAWQWDAFMALTGTPLPELVRATGRLPWPAVRPVLEQLAEELAAACAEDTLPDVLRPEQVWVRDDGRPQLLDLPVAGAEEPGGTAPAPERSLALLADVAVLAVEGRPRCPGDRGPVRVPLPLPAARALGRLLDPRRPYADVTAFQKDLKAGARGPAEVSRARRAGQVALLVAGLLVGGGCCMFPAGWEREFMPFVFQALKLHEQQRAVEGLDEGAALRFSAAAVNPDLWVRLRGVMDLEYDRRLRATLETDLRHERERRAARLGAMGPFGREQARGMEPLFVVGFDQAERDRARQFPQEFGPLQYRSRAWEALGMRVPTGDERNFVRTCFALVLAGPALWVVWAFLWRGGLSFRLAGIAVVRGDGRPASRWRGAWRALLAWGPVTGLLVASFWLEDSFWLAFAAGGGPGWQMTLALASWYAALGLLGVYAGLTLWWPARGPHDWLADTYLVPR